MIPLATIRNRRGAQARSFAFALCAILTFGIRTAPAQSETEVYSGEMVLAAGARSPNFEVRSQGNRPSVFVEGRVGSGTSRVQLIARYDDGSASDHMIIERKAGVSNVAAGPFSTTIPLQGRTWSLEIYNQGPADIALRTVRLTRDYPPPTPAPTPRPTPYPTPYPQPDPGYGNPPYGDPGYGGGYQGGGYGDERPPYDPAYDQGGYGQGGYGQPGYDNGDYYRPSTDYRGRTAAEVAFSGNYNVDEGKRSRWFSVNSHAARRAVAVEIEWIGRRGDADGYVYVNSEPLARWRKIPLSSRHERVDQFPVDFAVFSVALGAKRGDIRVRRVTVIYADEGNYLPRPPVVVDPPGFPFFPRPPFSPDPRPPAPHGESGVAERGLSFVKENRSIDIHLPGDRFIRTVEVKWSDGREKAVGYVSVDDEGWNARRGQDVGSPDEAKFDVYKNGRVVRLHAKRDDIRVLWVKVFYDPIDRGHGGGGGHNGGGGNPPSYNPPSPGSSGGNSGGGGGGRPR